MAQLLYFRDAAAGVFNTLQITTVPTTATVGAGWVVGTTGASNYSQIQRNAERAASTFSATLQPPDSGPDATLGDGFRTAAVLNGWYAAGTWTFAFAVIAVTAGATTDGRVRIRLWRSPNADGSAAIEITPGTQEGTTVTNLTTAQQISTVTVALPEFGLVDEYLFVSVAWRITGAGGGATDDVNWREGSAAVVTAPDFSAATTTEYQVVLAGRGLLVKKGDYVRRMAQQFAIQLSTTPNAGVRLGEVSHVVPNWAGGSGFPNYETENPTRYYQGLGVDVTSTKDKAQVGPALTASHSSSHDAGRVFGIYNGQLYVGYSTGQVYRQTSLDTWALVGTISSNRPVTAIYEAADDVDGVSARMWVANGSTAGVASWNGTTFTNNDADFGVGPTALDVVTALNSWSVPAPAAGSPPFVAGGTLDGSNQAICGAVQDGAFGGEWLETIERQNKSDVGYPMVTATLVAADGQFYWCASDTVALRGQVIKSTYAKPGTNNVQFLGEQSTLGYLPDDYLTALVESNGVMYGVGAAGRLYTVGSTGLTLVSADISPSGSELHGLAAWDNALWIPCRSGTTNLLVRRYGLSDPTDAASALMWSEPIYGGGIDASATAARQAIAFGGDLYVATEAAGASKVYRMRAGVFKTAAVTLQTGELTFDSAVIIKSVKLEHSALVASDSIQLKYSRNGSATFNTLGTNSTVGSTSSRYDVAASGQVTRLSVQAVITGGSSAATPQLGQLTIVVRPIGDVTREWNITMHTWGNASYSDKRKDGSPEPRTGQQIIDACWMIMEEGVTQRYRDLDNQIYTVTVDDWEDAPESELGHASGLRWSARCRLREV